MLANWAALHFMKLCCKPSFQQKHERLLLISSIGKGLCSEKASEQASLQLCEYLFVIQLLLFTSVNVYSDSPWVRSFQPNSQGQQHRLCLLQIHRVTTVSVHLFPNLGLGRAKECKWCQHPIWTFASHWDYFPTKIPLTGTNLSVPQRGCISPFSLLLKSRFPS